MLRSLWPEFVGGARQVVIAIMLMLAAIYVSGFLIVNLYLGQFGVTHLTFVQPRFIATGVLFMFFAGVAALFALFPFAIFSKLLDCVDWLWRNPQFEQYLAQPSQPASHLPASTQDDRSPSCLEQAIVRLLRRMLTRMFGDTERSGGLDAKRASRRRRG